MESQCHRERNDENAFLTSFSELKMLYEIEKHARNMYTHTNFYVFRDSYTSVRCTAMCRVSL